MYGVCPEQKSEKTASEIRVWRKNRCEKEKRINGKRAAAGSPFPRKTRYQDIEDK